MPFRSMLVAACLVFLAAPALASTVEQATGGGASYQFDGDSHHDAPDTCQDAAPGWSLPLDGDADGILVAPDDVADAYTLDIPSTLRGKRLTLAVAEPTSAQELRIDAFAPGCLGSILDTINWPRPEPAPPAPASGQRQVAVAAPTPDHCDSRQWIFVVDRLDASSVPASIYAAWTDGAEKAISLSHKHGEYAFYATGERLDVLLYGAWANLPDAWAGHFRLLVGPCDAQDGGAVYGLPPVLGDGLLSFTPVRAGRHVVVVELLAGAVPSLQPPVGVDLGDAVPVQPDEVVGPIAGDLGLGHSHDGGQQSQALVLPGAKQILFDPRSALPDGQVTVPHLDGFYAPMSCHYCLGGVQDVVEKVGYKLTARRAVA